MTPRPRRGELFSRSRSYSRKRTRADRQKHSWNYEFENEHVRMSDAVDPVCPLRPEVCAEPAARVLAVGKLHFENFGAWRDGECRLRRGIDPYIEPTRSLRRLSSRWSSVRFLSSYLQRANPVTPPSMAQASGIAMLSRLAGARGTGQACDGISSNAPAENGSRNDWASAVRAWNSAASACCRSDRALCSDGSLNRQYRLGIRKRGRHAPVRGQREGGRVSRGDERGSGDYPRRLDGPIPRRDRIGTSVSHPLRRLASVRNPARVSAVGVGTSTMASPAVASMHCTYTVENHSTGGSSTISIFAKNFPGGKDASASSEAPAEKRSIRLSPPFWRQYERAPLPTSSRRRPRASSPCGRRACRPRWPASPQSSRPVSDSSRRLAGWRPRPSAP